jgi:hypothetical protein
LIQSNSHIEECLRLIETKWQRGSREEWTSYDFEKLNTAIFDATGVSLSISTLKRLFGKVSYPNLPAVHTLNTLARFAGFEDWNDFRQHHPLPTQPTAPKTTLPTNYGEFAIIENPDTTTSPSSENNPTPPPPAKRTRLTRWWALLLLPLAVLLYSLLSSRNTPHTLPETSAFSFSCNKIQSEGVPNSVVFHYKTPVSSADSVFISQTWDLHRKTAVPPDGTEYSAIYYYPGYFVAKLIVDTQIVLTHTLMITSDGWLALAEGDPVPIYFKKEEVARKEGIEVDSATLERYHLALQPTPPKTRLFFMKDMGDLSDTSFTFETTLKTGFAQGSGICQNVQILLQCKDDIIIIPLAAKACIGDLSLYAAGAGATSRNADLSGFGCDLTKWTNLRVTSENHQMTFFINGKQAYSLHFPHDPIDIVGVQYRFSGTCAVRNARFTTRSRIIDLK